ncbi:MAG TPA: hypothetical protein VK400_07350 [Pyrinomonadaceae bacterium]|nr:hypothetical protein [Pyrinomonadaceae bacterium]
MFIFSTFAFGQQQGGGKGIDTQTRQINQDNNKTTSRPNDAGGRSWDWGAGKTKVRERLANPYRLTARRDVLVENILSLLKENKIIVDEASSRINDGFIVTQPFIFAKGSVTAPSELTRYAVLQTLDSSVWTGGRFTLTIEIQSIDGIQNNVAITAKVEGKSQIGIGSQWTTVQSSGVAEDEFLSRLVENVTGKSLDAEQVQQ